MSDLAQKQASKNKSEQKMIPIVDSSSGESDSENKKRGKKARNKG